VYSSNKDDMVFDEINSKDMMTKHMTQHNIVLTDKKFKYPNSSQIKDLFKNEPEPGSTFKKKVSEAVLPDLYQQYFESEADVLSDADLTKKAVELYGGEDEECFDEEYLQKWLTKNYTDKNKNPPEMISAPETPQSNGCKIHYAKNYKTSAYEKSLYMPFEVFKPYMINKIKTAIIRIMKWHRLTMHATLGGVVVCSSQSP
ncbi:MAG: hypothetical protein ACKOYP_14140, partial [Bacteroidota bacterium]